MTYKIVRFFKGHESTVIDTGLSLEEAQTHCHDPESSSKTATGAEGVARTKQYGSWFDGYEREDT